MKTLVNTSVFGLIPVPAAPDIDPVRVEEDKALTNDDQHSSLFSVRRLSSDRPQIYNYSPR